MKGGENVTTDIIEACAEIFRQLATAPGHIYPTGRAGEPRKRYITTIRRTGAGALEISGAAGVRTFYGYSQREAETRYNTEARRRRRSA